MKKILAMLLALVMVFALCACGSSASTAPAASSAPAEEAPAVEEEAIPDAASLISDAFIDPLADCSQYDDLIIAIKAEYDYA